MGNSTDESLFCLQVLHHPAKRPGRGDVVFRSELGGAAPDGAELQHPVVDVRAVVRSHRVARVRGPVALRDGERVVS